MYSFQKKHVGAQGFAPGFYPEKTCSKALRPDFTL